MKINWKDWLQIASNFTILIGVILVIFELQQSQSLARAQIAGDRNILQVSFREALIGENPDLVLLKACLEPENLTTHDKMVLSKIMQAQLYIAQHSRGPSLIADFDTNYETEFRRAFRAFFNYEYGKEFFNRAKVELPPEIVAIGEDELSNNRPSDCSEGSIHAF